MAQQSLQEPNMDQHRPNMGSIYGQHGPDMIQNDVFLLGRVKA